MNVAPNPFLQDPQVQKRLKRAAQEWLRTHDAKRIKFEKYKKRQKAKKDAKQAEANPGLVASYRKALRPR